MTSEKMTGEKPLYCTEAELAKLERRVPLAPGPNDTRHAQEVWRAERARQAALRPIRQAEALKLAQDKETFQRNILSARIDYQPDDGQRIRDRLPTFVQGPRHGAIRVQIADRQNAPSDNRISESQDWQNIEGYSLDSWESDELDNELHRRMLEERHAYAAKRANPEMEAQQRLSELAPGVTVTARDRENVGRIVSTSGQHALVHFRNSKLETEATVKLPLSWLTRIR